MGNEVPELKDMLIESGIQEVSKVKNKVVEEVTSE